MKKIFTLLTIVFLSAKMFAVSVTFNVDMTGKDVSTGVFVVGTVNGWVHTAMTDGNGDMIYTVTLDLAVKEYVFYYTTKTDWAAASRETLPAECGNLSANFGWAGDRAVNVVGTDPIVLNNKYSSCEGTVTRIAAVQNMDMSVSPNPTSGALKINGINNLRNLSVEILTVSGKKIKQLSPMQSGNEISMDLSGLPKGIYMVMVNSKQKSFSKKIVLK
jgi:hypothetical protein